MLLALSWASKSCFFCSLKACSFWLLAGCKNRARRQWQFWPGLASACILFTQPPMSLKAGWHLVTLSTMHVRQLLLLSRFMMMLSLKPCLNLMERMKRLFSRTHAQSSSRCVLRCYTGIPFKIEKRMTTWLLWCVKLIRHSQKIRQIKLLKSCSGVVR